MTKVFDKGFGFFYCYESQGQEAKVLVMLVGNSTLLVPKGEFLRY